MVYTGTNKEKKLLEICSAKGGYFTSKQASQIGYSYRLQHYHKTKGHWQESAHGLFRLADYPISPYDDLIRWSLWSRNRKDIPQAVISHQTALSVYELSDVMPSKIYLTVPPGFRKNHDKRLIIYKRILKPDDIESKYGFFITTPLRTLLDVAESSLSINLLEQSVRDAVKDGIIRLTQLENAKLSNEANDKIKMIIPKIRKEFAQ